MGERGILVQQEDNDDSLVRRIAQQDTQAYRRLVEKYLPFCIRFAERMTGNRQDAEEIAQDVCFRVWQEAANWKPAKAQFSTWLYRVLFNRCIDYKRKAVLFGAMNSEEHADAAQGAEEGMMKKQQAEQVQGALRALPERQRAAIVLSYYEGIQGREAAEIIGVSHDYFHQLLSKARQGLRQSLTEGSKERKSER